MRSIAVFIILIVLLTSLLNTASGKRKKGGRKGKLKAKIPLNSVLKRNSNKTATINGTATATPTVDKGNDEIVKLQKKSELLTKKLKSCQGKVLQAKTCKQRMQVKTKEMENVVQEGHVMKREMTSLEQKINGLKEIIRKEKAAADINLHEKLTEMKFEYEQKISYLETVVAGLNYSLIFHQEKSRKMEKILKQSAKIRESNLRARTNSKIFNLRSTIKSLNQTIKIIWKDHNLCLSKLRSDSTNFTYSKNKGKLPRDFPLISKYPKSRARRKRVKKPNRATAPPSLTPLTQSSNLPTSSSTSTSSEQMTTPDDKTSLDDETTFLATTDAETEDDDVTTYMMTTVDITTDLMTSDYVTREISTSNIFASGDEAPNNESDDVIIKMM